MWWAALAFNRRIGVRHVRANLVWLHPERRPGGEALPGTARAFSCKAGLISGMALRRIATISCPSVFVNRDQRFQPSGEWQFSVKSRLTDTGCAGLLDCDAAASFIELLARLTVS